MPSVDVLFAVSVVATLAGLAAMVATGLRGRRRLHLATFFPTAAVLLTAIYFAERLGQVHRFSSTVLAVHLPFAISTVVALVPAIATGIMRWRHPARKKPHRIFVIAFLCLAVLALGTGIMLLLAPRREA